MNGSVGLEDERLVRVMSGGSGESGLRSVWGWEESRERKLTLICMFPPTRDGERQRESARVFERLSDEDKHR